MIMIMLINTGVCFDPGLYPETHPYPGQCLTDQRKPVPATHQKER